MSLGVGQPATKAGRLPGCRQPSRVQGWGKDGDRGIERMDRRMARDHDILILEAKP
jgi:hypothetical protein